MLKFQSIIYLFYSKFYRKSISENLLQLSVIEKKVIAKIRREKVENFTFLNPYILENFIYNMKQPLYSEKRKLKATKYIKLIILVIKNVFKRF